MYHKNCKPVPDTHKSFTIPVYIYDCPLNSLTDQLVNKWTYRRPVDIYQDLTFASETEDKIREDGEEAKKEVGKRNTFSLLFAWY